MPGDDEADLPVPGGVRADHAVVDRAIGRAEQVVSLPKRIGGQVPDRLPLEDEQREVVRRRVDERDRDERVDELVRQSA
jgi:hypothetical protein